MAVTKVAFVVAFRNIPTTALLDRIRKLIEDDLDMAVADGYGIDVESVDVDEDYGDRDEDFKD